jgi:hypothetical protein
MEFVNTLYNSLLLVISFILFFSVLLHGYRLFFYKEVFKEFKEGVSSYFSCLIKAHKNYKLQFLSSLFIFYSPMSFYQTLDHVFSGIIRDFFFLKLLFFLIGGYLFDIIFSYMLLGCYDLLKNGKVFYRSILSCTREIGKKIVCFSFLVGIIMYFLHEYIFISSFKNILTVGSFLERFTLLLQLSMISLLILVPLGLFCCYFLLFLLIDQESYKKAASSSMHFFYKSIPLYLGLLVSKISLSVLFEIILRLVLFLLQYVYPQLFSGFLIVKPLFSFYIRQLLALGEYIAIVSYWLYSRKKQTVPFGKEYIESLEG